MAELIGKYRKILEQGFMPICVGDRFDIGILAQAALDAGASAIEITSRRSGARTRPGPRAPPAEAVAGPGAGQGG